ncbi:hypothetical protein COO91_10669 (plasmid) [Nostoc flagelliforme CCNUN1]|uniref:Uncharacterized protein n=1 Tax=Nostoc flagelliforme CCNUN1 TaxID=2038116 RepID=A0A2K8T9R9_9NOSO|nr:hypothetical protein COO91_10669 [Nostoc flagelliforme CCNUN1]
MFLIHLDVSVQEFSLSLRAKRSLLKWRLSHRPETCVK